MVVVAPVGALRGTMVILDNRLLDFEQKIQERTMLGYIQAAKQGPETDRRRKEKKVKGEKRRGESRPKKSA